MIFVIESYFLKSEYTPQALTVLQELDDLLGPNAHANPGHTGHAHFLQDASDPTQVRLVYAWGDQGSFADLARSEEPLLVNFLEKYCCAPRLIQVHRELPVEVDHHEDGENTNR
jgi:hypothetical protein